MSARVWKIFLARGRGALLLAAYCGALVAVAALVAPPATATVVGTKHDLSPTGGGNWQSTDTDEVCVFCHTPHNANVTDGAPLWNHELPSGTFDLYSSATLDAAPGQPQGVSLLCLSCHDGVMALNSLANPPGGTNPAMDPNGDQLGDIYYPGSPYHDGMGPNIGGNYPGGGENVNDLSDDHPISFTFDANLVSTDGGLKLPASDDAVQLFGSSKNQLECASCHDVHSETYEPFLVKSNTGSALCLTCHVK